MRGSTGPISSLGSADGQQPSNDVQEIKKIIKNVQTVCDKILRQKGNIKTPESIEKMEKICEEIKGLNIQDDANAKKTAPLLQFMVQQVTMALHEIKPKTIGSEGLKSSIKEAEGVLHDSNTILNTIKTRPGLPPVKSGTDLPPIGDFITGDSEE